jgi:hypothetical protein
VGIHERLRAGTQLPTAQNLARSNMALVVGVLHQEVQASMIVHAATHLKLVRVLGNQAMHALNRARTFLDGLKIGAIPQPVDELKAHFRACPGGEVIEHDWQVKRVIHGQRVRQELLLGRLAVVRSGKKNGVVTGLFRVMPEIEAFVRAGRVDARHQRHPPLNQFHDAEKEFLAFGITQCVILAGGAPYDQAIDTLLHEAIYQRLECSPVNVPICIKRGDDWRPNAVEIRAVSSILLTDIRICLRR